MIYIRASRLPSFALAVNISHTSHNLAGLSTFILFKINFLQMTKAKQKHFHNKNPASPLLCLLTHTVWVLPQMLSTPKSSPQREGRHGAFSSLTFMGEARPSPCQYTDSPSVINLLVSIVWHRPPVASSFFPPPHPRFSSSLLQNPEPIHMPGHPDRFICQAILLTQWIAGPLCVMQIWLGYRGDRRQQAIQVWVKTQLKSLLFYCSHPLFFPSSSAPSPLLLAS